MYVRSIFGSVSVSVSLLAHNLSYVSVTEMTPNVYYDVDTLLFLFFVNFL